MPSTVLRKEEFLEQVLKQIRPESGAVYQNLEEAFRLAETDELFEATRTPSYSEILQTELRKTLSDLLLGPAGFKQGSIMGLSGLIRGVTKATRGKAAPSPKPQPKPSSRPSPVRPPTGSPKKRKRKDPDGFTGVYIADDVDFILEFIYLWIVENADLFTLSQAKTRRSIRKVAHRIAS